MFVLKIALGVFVGAGALVVIGFVVYAVYEAIQRRRISKREIELHGRKTGRYFA